jgi:glycosyltransferase involved in cell wall biosynthesis
MAVSLTHEPAMSSTTPLVSTVIPTYNRRRLIERSVDSALAQTYRHQEVIVVDDGSTDGTGDFLQERYGQRIRYLWQPNGGVSNARNHGMRLARGDLIALLDSDDLWDPTKLERQVQFLLAHSDFGMVLTDVRRVDGAGNPIDVFRRRDVIRADGDALADVLMNPALVPASILIRRRVFDELGGFDESLRTAEDIEFHLRIAASFKIGVIEEVLTIAARANDGLSSLATSDSDYVQVVERFVSGHRGRLSAAARRAALFALYERTARSACRSGRVWQGWRYWVRAATRVRSTREASSMANVLVLSGRVVGARLFRRRESL